MLLLGEETYHNVFVTGTTSERAQPQSSFSVMFWLPEKCECIDQLDDTRDVRWISLISVTVKHAVLIRRITGQSIVAWMTKVHV